jgi:transposase-like protein
MTDGRKGRLTNEDRADLMAHAAELWVIGKNISQIAEELDVEHKTVSNWTKHDDWQTALVAGRAAALDRMRRASKGAILHAVEENRDASISMRVLEALEPETFGKKGQQVAVESTGPVVIKFNL